MQWPTQNCMSFWQRGCNLKQLLKLYICQLIGLQSLISKLQHHSTTCIPMLLRCCFWRERPPASEQARKGHAWHTSQPQWQILLGRWEILLAVLASTYVFDPYSIMCPSLLVFARNGRSRKVWDEKLILTWFTFQSHGLVLKQLQTTFTSKHSLSIPHSAVKLHSQAPTSSKTCLGMEEALGEVFRFIFCAHIKARMAFNGKSNLFFNGGCNSRYPIAFFAASVS